MSDLRYLLWANDRQMWWRPDAWGYTTSQDEAGRYAEAEALRYVVQSAHAGRLDEATVMISAGREPATEQPHRTLTAVEDDAQRAALARTHAVLDIARQVDAPDEPITDADRVSAALDDKTAETAEERAL